MKTEWGLFGEKEGTSMTDRQGIGKGNGGRHEQNMMLYNV